MLVALLTVWKEYCTTATNGLQITNTIFLIQLAEDLQFIY